MSWIKNTAREVRFNWPFFAIMTLLATVAVGGTVYGIVNYETTESDYERFHRVCAEQGGFVADTPDPDWLTERIDCIKDNKILYLPGFA